MNSLTIFWLAQTGMSPGGPPLMSRASGPMHRYPSLGRLGLEFSALLRFDGLVSPAEIASIIGKVFPIAL